MVECGKHNVSCIVSPFVRRRFCAVRGGSAAQKGRRKRTEQHSCEHTHTHTHSSALVVTVPGCTAVWLQCAAKRPDPCLGLALCARHLACVASCIVFLLLPLPPLLGSFLAAALAWTLPTFQKSIKPPTSVHFPAKAYSSIHTKCHHNTQPGHLSGCVIVLYVTPVQLVYCGLCGTA